MYAHEGWADEISGLVSGGYCVLLSDKDEDGILGRRKGLELRDTILVLRSGGVGYAYVFRRPFTETVVDQLLESGAGCFDIDGSRASSEGQFEAEGGEFSRGDRPRDKYRKGVPMNMVPSMRGRWPSNLVLVHVIGCVGEVCVEGCPVGYVPTEFRRYYNQVGSEVGLVRWLDGLVGNRE